MYVFLLLFTSLLFFAALERFLCGPQYNMEFRKDINGLRAIALIAVILFHFNPLWLPGGFAGVDIFFVISGYLMTKIIFSGIEKQDFSIFKFYVSRANRIVPALALLCFVLSCFFGVGFF